MHQYPATVIRVIDGDSIVVNLQAHVLGIKFEVKDVYLRLLDVDTPEMRGDERAEGVLAKKFIEDLLLGESVVIESDQKDSFGRWLAYVYYRDYNVSELLIEEGYGEPY